MATVTGVVAETDCCGNLYPLHVPIQTTSARRECGAPAAALVVALAARLIWTVALACAWSGLL